VTQSWHLLFVGFLFGLGFDTATEVALFGISSAQATNGVSFSTIMVFPALFTAGMSAIDTTDGVLMLSAYGWAFNKPIRKALLQYDDYSCFSYRRHINWWHRNTWIGRGPIQNGRSILGC